MNERAKQLHDDLIEQVKTLGSSQRWQDYLRFMGSFHAYSLNNIMLIQMQRPGATHVAGFRKWQENGRQVRKGEKAIKIFGYRRWTKTNEDGEDEDGVYFPVVNVFDISQTDLIDPATDPDIVHDIDGDDLGVWQKMRNYLMVNQWTVQTGDTGSAYGRTSLSTRTVTVRAGLSPAHSAKTLLHEAAHVTLHTDLNPQEYQTHRGVYETEAESVAFVLAGLAGLDTSAYSVGYVAGWSEADSDLLKETASNVLRAVHLLAPIIEGVPK